MSSTAQKSAEDIEGKTRQNHTAKKYPNKTAEHIAGSTCDDQPQKSSLISNNISTITQESAEEIEEQTR